MYVPFTKAKNWSIVNNLDLLGKFYLCLILKWFLKSRNWGKGESRWELSRDLGEETT